MSSNAIYDNAVLAREAGFEVHINEMKPSLVIETGPARFSFEGLEADDILDIAQDVADSHEAITQKDALLHFAMCWSEGFVA